MKRILAFVIALLSLLLSLGCVNESAVSVAPSSVLEAHDILATTICQKTTKPQETTEPYEDVPMISAIYPDEQWGSLHGIPLEGDRVPDKVTAINIAVQIHNALEDDRFKVETAPQFVFYDEKDEVWIVSFWEDGREGVLDGGELRIIIRKSDAAVLSVHISR